MAGPRPYRQRRQYMTPQAWELSHKLQSAKLGSSGAFDLNLLLRLLKGGDGIVYSGKWHGKDAAFKHVITKTPFRKLSVASECSYDL